MYIRTRHVYIQDSDELRELGCFHLSERFGEFKLPTPISKNAFQDSYGDLATTSPTIISTKPLNFNVTNKFHPSDNKCFTKFKGCSEITVWTRIPAFPPQDILSCGESSYSYTL